MRFGARSMACAYQAFSETNLFDALYDTLDRVDRIEGHKYVILITSGIDTFSKLNLDQITKKVKATHDVTIFPVSIGGYLRIYCETHGCTGRSHGMASLGMSNIDYLQADNEMQTFAKLTGGRVICHVLKVSFRKFSTIFWEMCVTSTTLPTIPRIPNRTALIAS